MVLYFSATGNTRFVAKELAKALDDEAMDLCGRIKEAVAAALNISKTHICVSKLGS